MPSWRSTTRRSEWPADLHWVFDLFVAHPDAQGIRSGYTPRFMAVSPGEKRIVHTSVGTGGWAHDFKPWLDRTLGV